MSETVTSTHHKIHCIDGRSLFNKFCILRRRYKFSIIHRFIPQLLHQVRYLLTITICNCKRKVDIFLFVAIFCYKILWMTQAVRYSHKSCHQNVKQQFDTDALFILVILSSISMVYLGNQCLYNQRKFVRSIPAMAWQDAMDTVL